MSSNQPLGSPLHQQANKINWGPFAAGPLCAAEDLGLLTSTHLIKRFLVMRGYVVLHEIWVNKP